MGVTGLRCIAGAATSVGLLRSHNEDDALVRDNLFAVADGMGGHAAGDEAARLAIAALDTLPRSGPVGAEEIHRSIRAGHEAIRRTSEARLDHARMGTTITGAVLSSPTDWLIFNVGDSRVYLHADGQLSQITRDHSEVADLVASGQLDPELVPLHPRRHVITRSLGGARSPLPDFFGLPLAGGQTLLICSDGLTNEVSDSAIAAVLASGQEPAEAARGLVALADANGGRDNSTVIVVRVQANDQAH